MDLMRDSLRLARRAAMVGTSHANLEQNRQRALELANRFNRNIQLPGRTMHPLKARLAVAMQNRNFQLMSRTKMIRATELVRRLAENAREARRPLRDIFARRA